MLNRLTIKNIALIESAEIIFTEGLNVLSGETGSGKSVILESLNFVLGDKADKSLIRTGASECFVQAEFDVQNNSAIFALFDEFDIEKDDVIIISRKFTIDGKSSIKLNGVSVTSTMLRKFTSQLVDVHGQSEHFYLLNTSNQLKLLDGFCGDKILPVKTSLVEYYNKLVDVNKALDKMGGDEYQRLVKMDVLKFQINEINNADIKDGEEENLISLKDKLKNQELIASSLKAVKDTMTSEGGAIDLISNSLRFLRQISELSEEYSELNDRLNNIYAEADDLSTQCENLLENLSDSEYSLEEVQARLDVIKNLKKKYGSNYIEIQEFLVNAVTELENLENFNEKAEQLLAEKNELKTKLYDGYIVLSQIRKDGAIKLSENIINELIDLGMPKAKFYVDFAQIPSFEDCKFQSSNGIDDIKFMFSANSGEPAKSLSEIISGGEMSRFMLAFKAQSAKFNDISTYVFDEIDAGISGNIAKVVSQKFAKLSKNVQIISVTHLPQISSMADNNLLITKSENEDKTVTSVKRLDADEKIKEITRLVGGSVDNKSAVELAKDLISQANNYKNNL